METNWYAFFLPSSLALLGLQKGSILWSPYTAIKENTMKRNTQNLILYTGRVHQRNRHLGRTHLVTLQVWSITWWVCMHEIYTEGCHKSNMHIDDTKIHWCNLNASTHMLANTHMHSYCTCNQCWFRLYHWGGQSADLNICSSQPAPSVPFLANQHTAASDHGPTKSVMCKNNCVCNWFMCFHGILVDCE